MAEVWILQTKQLIDYLTMATFNSMNPGLSRKRKPVFQPLFIWCWARWWFILPRHLEKWITITGEYAVRRAIFLTGSNWSVRPAWIHSPNSNHIRKAGMVPLLRPFSLWVFKSSHGNRGSHWKPVERVTAGHHFHQPWAVFLESGPRQYQWVLVKRTSVCSGLSSKKVS